MRTIQGFNLKSTIHKDALLAKLRENRERHAKIVEEAQAGYVKEAQQAIGEKLVELKLKKIASLYFGLHPPIDHTEAYDTVIEMLDMSTDDHIVLNSSDFRNLVMDEWEWKDDFLVANSGYSASALTEAKSKGL